ncbi:HlyD family secretion protein [Clostridium aminobutyricum]|uniref:HlyD family secretion protein n=1 Tax=Clostridium aminobutyricum TaxID=33953 RepID=A0A939D7N3_CLOAM|nr:HlyD family efflux transporter periplasmic adaptor subunit [Clostridium aminobutyricum]MBN7772328.1 HlyD family secretion protein [Clostridium aminobutyricum]
MNGKRKLILLCIAAAMVITLGGVGLYYWYNTSHFVSTEDARVAGDFIKITSEISGKLKEFDAVEGESLAKNQIVGRMSADGLADSSIDKALLRSPINGILIKKQAGVGEFISAGTALAVMVDPNQLYISANIKETELNKIKVGQKVDIKIDQFGGRTFQGKVESIGEAAGSAFSLLPSSSSGTFTKVVQNVPVKIALEKIDVKVLPGTNAIVKIHLK